MSPRLPTEVWMDEVWMDNDLSLVQVGKTFAEPATARGLKLVHGVAFPEADDFMCHEMRPDGTYQADHLQLAMKLWPKRGIAVDGGAHVGLWTRILSENFERVLAFEPAADTAAALKYNVEAVWRLPNVSIFHMALLDRMGLARLTLDTQQAARRNTGGRYAEPVSAAPASPDPACACVVLDNVGLTELSLLKLDIEGSEYQALQGARETIRHCRPMIIVEDKGLGARYFGQPRDAVAKLLRRWGYRQRARAGADVIWTPATPAEGRRA